MKKTTTISPAVYAANDLTAQWCGRLGGEDFIISGAGLWPLLALLASAADETAAAELAASIGRPASSAQQDALELISVLRAGASTTAALGLWTRKGIALHEQWVSGFPAGVVGTLTDQENARPVGGRGDRRADREVPAGPQSRDHDGARLSAGRKGEVARAVHDPSARRVWAVDGPCRAVAEPDDE